MKTPDEGLVLSVDPKLGLEARDLPAECVSFDDEVDQPEPLAVEHDHPRTRAEDRRREGADGLVEPVEAHQTQHRRRLAARDHQAVEVVQVLRQPHLERLDAESAQHRGVLAERTLECEHADPE